MARNRRPIVCQYLENLRSAALERYADLIREMVGRRHGVYALYRKRRLYYVGLASNLRGRLKSHVRDRHAGKWDVFSVYLTIDDGHMKELESLVLRIASPRGNKQRGKFAKAENLMRVLKAELRKRQSAELRSLGRGSDVNDPFRIQRQRRTKRKRGEPTLARFIDRAISLRRMYKGKMCRAHVRKDGRVRVGPHVYTSPSHAATAIVGRPVNGWWFWTYQRAPGQWVKLQELRRR
jgi:hypothetical protein